MPDRQAKDNVTKTLNLIHTASWRNIEGLLLSAEKAFSGVAWDYMLRTCTHVGLYSHMLALISALNKNPSAKLKVNGSLSESEITSNGTRQGWPLSPLLFILSLELFIRRVNAKADVKGFRVLDRV